MKLAPVIIPVALISLSVITREPVPTVRIPVIRASPSTIKAVVAVPVFTTAPFLAVISPTESTFLTSSYVNTPPTLTLPLNVDTPVTLIPLLVSGPLS